MCLEEAAAAAEGEQRGVRDATSQLLSKLSSGHEGGMKEESEQVDTGVFRIKEPGAHIAWWASRLLM